MEIAVVRTLHDGLRAAEANARIIACRECRVAIAGEFETDFGQPHLPVHLRIAAPCDTIDVFVIRGVRDLGLKGPIGIPEMLEGQKSADPPGTPVLLRKLASLGDGRLDDCRRENPARPGLANLGLHGLPERPDNFGLDSPPFENRQAIERRH